MGTSRFVLLGLDDLDLDGGALYWFLNAYGGMGNQSMWILSRIELRMQWNDICAIQNSTFHMQIVIHLG